MLAGDAPRVDLLVLLCTQGRPFDALRDEGQPVDCALFGPVVWSG